MSTELTDCTGTPTAAPTVDRIAELVAELTGCSADGAATVVGALAPEGGASTADDALELVARALHAVTEAGSPHQTPASWSRPRRRRPVPTEPMRLTGYVRAGGGPARHPLPSASRLDEQGGVIDLRDPVPARDDLRVARYLDHLAPRLDLVEHGSLRRWERPHRSTPIATAVEP